MGMEGIDRKTVVSPTVSNKYGKKAVYAVQRASQAVPQSVKQCASYDPIVPHPDSTRFGDWERAGRCIEF